MNISIEDRQSLIKKQEILDEIANLQKQISHLPEQEEIELLEKLELKDTKIIESAKLADLKRVLDKFRGDLDKVNIDKENNNQKLMNKSLSGNELMFVQNDIERQTKRQNELKHSIEETALLIQKVVSKVETLEKETLETEKKIESLKTVVKEKSLDTVNKIKHLTSENENLKISKEMLELFENHSLDGIGVAFLLNNSICSACNLVQPLSVINEFKGDATKLSFCEECERILLLPQQQTSAQQK